MALLMDDQGETNSFGIVLLLDRDTATRVERLRAQLTTKPVRAEVPHVMLLRGISSERVKSDEELLRDSQDLIYPIITASYLGWVERICNLNGRRYGKSSVAEVGLPDDLAEEREQLIKGLEARGHSIEASEKTGFWPRITIGLGASLPEGIEPGELPPGHDLEIVDYAILRLVVKDNELSTRLVRAGE